MIQIGCDQAGCPRVFGFATIEALEKVPKVLATGWATVRTETGRRLQFCPDHTPGPRTDGA